MKRSIARRTVSQLALIALIAVLGGCASHTVVPSSGPRSATKPDRVKIYQDYPKRYELLGIIALPVTPDERWDERGDANPGFDHLKAAAAALGANGLLLARDIAPNDVLVTAGYHGAMYQVPIRSTPKSVVAAAIYVLGE
jgi:hypothetical protein